MSIRVPPPIEFGSGFGKLIEAPGEKATPTGVIWAMLLEKTPVGSWIPGSRDRSMRVNWTLPRRLPSGNLTAVVSGMSSVTPRLLMVVELTLGEACSTLASRSLLESPYRSVPANEVIASPLEPGFIVPTFPLPPLICCRLIGWVI